MQSADLAVRTDWVALNSRGVVKIAQIVINRPDGTLALLMIDMPVTMFKGFVRYGCFGVRLHRSQGDVHLIEVL